MKIQKRPECRVIGCTKRPNFGIIYKKPLTCKRHKEDNFIDVANKRCVSYGCRTRPIFGLPGKKGQHCHKHRQEDEVDVVNNKCTSPWCTKQRSFGFPGEKPTHCGEHCLVGHINLNSKKCIIENCNVNPMYGFSFLGERGTHCFNHKLPGQTDVNNPTCEVCSSRAKYAPEGHRPVRCSVHKLDNDIGNNTCREPGCLKIPNYGIKMWRPLTCVVHKIDGYKYVTITKCETKMCSVYELIDRPRMVCKRDGVKMCGSCLRQMYPESNKVRVRQEHFMLSEIQRRMPQLNDYFMLHDCPLPCATSMERPDMLWMVGTTLLHIEIDETNCHEDDRNRLMRILAGTNGVEHIVLRIHTHMYKEKGITYPPCFKKIALKNGEKGIIAHEKEFERRMDIVVNNIENLIENDLSCILHLFRDNRV